jgi:hypothetical protein
LSQHYYLLATLPSLSPAVEHFPSTEAFLALCRQWLTRGDLSLVENTTLIPVEATPNKLGNGLLRAWYNFEYGLRNEMARQRAQKLNKDATPYLRNTVHGQEYQVDQHMAESVRTALQASNPATAERIIDALRWRSLEDLSFGHHFDIQAVQLYYLKLQILERASLFSRKVGEENYHQLYEAVVAKAKAAS